MASLRREVHRFDFEEAANERMEFPSEFYRHVAAELGFPPFGSMRLTRETAAGGEVSFQFTLQGGSMAARVPIGVIPIMPPGDYMVTAMVRTRGLTTARAQVAAWYVDDHGRAIPGTEATSQPSLTADRWAPVAFAVPCQSPAAVDLVIELRLLQRRHVELAGHQWTSGGAPGGGPDATIDGADAHADGPLLDDVSGEAWFDDVVIWQLPRIDLTTTWPGQLIPGDQSVRLRVLVDDRTSQALTATVRVTDLDGAVVAEHRLVEPRGALPRTVDLGQLPGGWYRTDLAIFNGAEQVISRRLDFTVLGALAEPAEGRPMGFAVTLPAGQAGRVPTLAAMVQRLGVGQAQLLMGRALFTGQRSEVRGQRSEVGGQRSAVSPRGQRPEVSHHPSPAHLLTSSPAHLLIPSSPRQAIDDLLSQRVQLTFVIDQVPACLARQVDAQPTQVLRVLAADDAPAPGSGGAHRGEGWRAHIDPALLSLGRRVRRWQAGFVADESFASADEMAAVYDRAASGLSTIIPGLHLGVPWPGHWPVPNDSAIRSIQIDHPAWDAPGGAPGGHASSDFQLPSATTPAGPEVITRLIPLPMDRHSLLHARSSAPPGAGADGQFPRGPGDAEHSALGAEPHGPRHPRGRVVDLSCRALAAWRSGAAVLTIDAPWSDDDALRPMPAPEFGPWRGLAHGLHQRQFAGELPVGDGLICWILRGQGRVPRADRPGPRALTRDLPLGTQTSALVAWNQSAPPGQAAIHTLLADGPVLVTDLWGNTRTVEPDDGRHLIPLDDLPVFIEHIDQALAQFLATFAVEPAFLPAMHRPHELTIVVQNPWEVTISGQVRLHAAESWQITPRTSEFSVRPGETARLPITLVLNSNVVAGAKRLDAEVQVQAHRAYALRLTAPLQVGLQHITVKPSWTTSANARTGELDLVVVLHATNSGPTTVHLDGYVSGPGISPQRRPIGPLGPGQSAARSFQIASGATLLAGRRLRAGVVDRNTSARLNQAIDLPPIILEQR